MKLEDILKLMKREAIGLKILNNGHYQCCKTRFGGNPDLPSDFRWPTNTWVNYEGKIETNYLAFILQINCEELSKCNDLLPKKGLISFFYDVNSMNSVYEEADRSNARVYYFSDLSVLKETSYPVKLDDYYLLPNLNINLHYDISYPSFEDVYSIYEEFESFDYFYEVWNEMTTDNLELESKLLGWPNIIQGCMAYECELISNGIRLEDFWEANTKLTKEFKIKALNEWILLLQIDTSPIELSLCTDFCRLYYYIRKEDLLNKDFSKIICMKQCD